VQHLPQQRLALAGTKEELRLAGEGQSADVDRVIAVLPALVDKLRNLTVALKR
jgi:hypothetical protein